MLHRAARIALLGTQDVSEQFSRTAFQAVHFKGGKRQGDASAPVGAEIPPRSPCRAEDGKMTKVSEADGGREKAGRW